MGKVIDLTGQKFNRLTVLERAENSKCGKARWLCRCECGNEVIVLGSSLTSGHTKSCGCLSREKFLEHTKTHGMTRTSIYNTWVSMIQRCENPKCKNFDRYGGRGIKVCERWHDFNNFYADVSILPHFGEKGYTLDRIDNNGNYCPENCRWATAKEQCRNQRTNIKVFYDGKEMMIEEAAQKSGINHKTLYKRYHAGKRGEELFKPVKK